MTISTAEWPNRIRTLRGVLGISQAKLAELLGVSFVTVSRWENGHTTPTNLAISRLQRAELLGVDGFADQFAAEGGAPSTVSNEPEFVDFQGSAAATKSVIEAERLSYGHLFNPAFATESAVIDPLPHQRIAVYERMLAQTRIRFLLADDAGAGKTIMAGLLIRELLARRVIRRVLVVAPAGLIGNWEKELRTLFSLEFNILVGGQMRGGNPFADDDGDLVIVSVDTLAGERAFRRLQEPAVAPYDLVIFDEAHKLSADREADLSIRRTDRYRLAEALAGIHTGDDRWTLNWSAQHLILLTATPHMGKEYPYFCLWRLLEPFVFSTFDAFQSYPPDLRRKYFIRRTKEEMVKLDGTPLYPMRVSDTVGFELTQGPISEQALYDRTTAYLETFYNRARILNRQAAAMAMSVFQRRLASSTYALMRSFERRVEKLDGLIEEIQSGRLSPEQLLERQRELGRSARDSFESLTGDEEEPVDDREQNEADEDRLLGGVVAVNLAELAAERQQVDDILDLARKIYSAGDESKFEKLREVIKNPEFQDEKLLIFTEHRDTLDFLIQRLEGMGFGNQIAKIHGGMDYRDRQDQVDFFRRPVEANGARFMVCTDAAAEGINLQFCWLMVNYDIPWNPARLEQRMGRIHRYGQKKNKVVIVNIVAHKTREGRVIKTLLDKLETIRKALGSDKVFDVIGRLFEGASLRSYIEQALTDADSVVEKINGTLTKEQVVALQVRERTLFGDGGEVKRELARMRIDVEREMYRRLLPGYVRSFVEKVAPLVDLNVDGSLDTTFRFTPAKSGARWLDPVWAALEGYPPIQRERLTVHRPTDRDEAVFLHPGEPVFEALRRCVSERFARDGTRGAVFVDVEAEKPYSFHVAVITIERKADESVPALRRPEVIEHRLVAVRQGEGGEMQTCPVEQALLYRDGQAVPLDHAGFARLCADSIPNVLDFVRTAVAGPVVSRHRAELVSSIPGRSEFLNRGFDFQEAELAAQRAKLAGKVRDGDAKARGDVTKIRERQRLLEQRRTEALQALGTEPGLVETTEIEFIAHALVVPSQDPQDQMRHSHEVERIAMRVARSYEEAEGAEVKDVCRPELARAAGLDDWCGFDLLAFRSMGEQRAIEVKGRAEIGDIEMKENEWARACILRERYWLYVVYECASASPRLLRIQDPFGKLVVRPRGGVIIDEAAIFKAAEPV